MEKVNIQEKFDKFNDHWNPRIVGELNGQQVKLARLKGEFIWHSHEYEDELFWIVKGKLKIELRDRMIELQENEFFIVPRGVEHKPIAEEEVQVMLFEPASTEHTGKEKHELTRKKLDHI